MQSAVSSLVTQAVNPCSTSAPFRYAVASSRQPRRPVNTAAASRGTRLCTCYTQSRAAAEPAGSEPDAESQFDRERASLRSFADNLRGEQAGSSGARSDLSSSHVGPVLERAFLVGVAQKGKTDRFAYNVHESLEELGRLAETAGLEVVGQTFQNLETVSPRTYIGSGKTFEVEGAVDELEADTVIFDDELTPGQLRNLEKAWGDRVRLCDRTALILDIFSQRAATKEGQLQVELAQSEYQLPRLTRMWTHLERQAGGRVRGMGEKQIEVDKRILRTRMGQLRRSLEDVRMHRKQYRERRAEAPVPVVALVGYTNAGKSTLLNKVTEASVLAEDKLFATLDPTTRRVSLPSSKEVLLTDTVGFIQKLPTQLVAAFRATLEEITEASLLLHVVDVSHPNAAAQTQAVMQVLEELDVGHIPMISVWNKVDVCADPEMVKTVASKRDNTVCISAHTGEGLPDLMNLVQQKIEQSMMPINVLVPYAQGELSGEIHKVGIVEAEQFVAEGSYIKARVPVPLAMRLAPFARDQEQQQISSADLHQ
ncbi:hypothetical protein ABBQ32_009189 [Trebouxia sp. C0010 RCD-2024]